MLFDSKQKRHPQYSRIPFTPFGTLSGLIHHKLQCTFTVELAVWSRILSESPSQNGPGKVFLICGPKITDVETRERKAEKVFHSCMFQFLEAIELRFTQVWVHDERRERNDTGICLTLALEWMVESVAGGKDGLNIQRNDDQQITGIKGSHCVEM
ncbi:hypothetical protein DFH07DRAFT_772421 [Mycena maculata]|uniref:Uncharacterized protein n=1 Tax=Mycena maculata TaxID=230809 RepID=A0AAD7J7R4_9AGAR|nr:hypothetical protein DFH07DRAFT_772421 [Mycena maculata]